MFIALAFFAGMMAGGFLTSLIFIAVRLGAEADAADEAGRRNSNVTRLHPHPRSPQ